MQNTKTFPWAKFIRIYSSGFGLGGAIGLTFSLFFFQNTSVAIKNGFGGLGDAILGGNIAILTYHLFDGKLLKQLKESFVATLFAIKFVLMITALTWLPLFIFVLFTREYLESLNFVGIYFILGAANTLGFWNAGRAIDGWDKE
jgi:hypothetical protein